MNYRLYNELKDIDENLLVSFFDSYIIETDYFHCRRDDLMSLKEYLLELKYKKRRYDTQTEGIVSQIKKSNNDIIFIEPYFDTTSNDLVVCEKDKLLVTPNKLEKELLPILDIISKNDYTEEKNGFISVSKNFIINPICFSIVQVLLKDKIPLAELELQGNEYEVTKFNKKYIKRYTRDNVKRIYLNK